MEKGKTTGSLTSILRKTDANGLNDYFGSHAGDLVEEEKPFAAYMRAVFRQKGVLQQTVFLNADISENYGYKLISEEKHTRQRDVVLRLCLAARFTLTEVQKALQLYGMSPLYARIRRDAALIIAFNTKMYDIAEVDGFLKKHELKPLSPAGEGE